MADSMPTKVKEELEKDRLLLWFRSIGIDGPWECLECKAQIRRPRYLKQQDGRRYVTLTFCSQPCHDAYFGRFRIPPVRWEKYDEKGDLIGYVVSGQGFISLDEIQAMEMEKEGGK